MSRCSCSTCTATRDANNSGPAKQGHVLGDQQAHWLANALDRSTATWKIVQADMPIG
jgi:alkaline phosphatase D